MTLAPYYADDLVTLYCAEAEEILPDLEGVDLVFTSPPYNLGTSNGGPSGMKAISLAAKNLAGGYADSDDALPQEVYDEWQTEIVRLCWTTLSDRGALFYNHKPRVQGGICRLPTDYGADLPLRQVITWDRGTGMNFSKHFYLPKSEWIVVWAKPDWRLVSKSASQIGDVWRVSPEQDTAHPAPFPLGLPARAIETTAPTLVLDPFAGSGTTLRAACDAGVRSIGIERSQTYCDLIVQRLGQRSLFGEDGVRQRSLFGW